MTQIHLKHLAKGQKHPAPESERRAETRRAEARRTQTKWLYRLEVNSIIERLHHQFHPQAGGAENRSEKEIVLECGARVADELVRTPWSKRFPALEDFAAVLRRSRTVDEFDRLMGPVFSFCDQNRIWLGLPWQKTGTEGEDDYNSGDGSGWGGAR